MKLIYYLFAITVLFVTSCVPSFNDVGEPFDSPVIKEMLAGNESGMIPQINAIYNDAKLDTVFIKDKTVKFSKIYLQANLDKGCTIRPVDDAPVLGTYGDFSKPRKYLVTASSGNSAEWTIIMDYYIPPVGCLTERWIGNVNCTDEIYQDYSPTFCTGKKLNNDCKKLELTFDFWADAAAVVVLELQLGDINMDTFKGDLTLVKDVTVSSWGETMTFHKGKAGTYNAIANELYLDLGFSGYDIGGGNYKFTVRQKK